MKKLLLLAGLMLGLYAPTLPAHAQTPANCGVNFTPVVGVNCANVRTATYVGQILNLTVASAGTDFWCVDASATKSVSIRRVVLSGVATANGTVPVSMIRRNTLDTGTAGTPNITALSVNNPTSTATVVSYAANPTITDSTSHQTGRVTYLTLTTAATPTTEAIPVLWEFGTSVDAYNQGFDLAKNSTAQLCLNFGGATAAGNILNGYVEWTEQ